MMHTAPSVCPLDCADTCSFTVTVEDDGNARVTVWDKATLR